MRRLSQGEARVTEIAQPFDMSLNAVSKHILILERARLVQRRRQGRQHILSATPRPLGDAADWIENYRRLWEERFDQLGDYLDEIQTKEKRHAQPQEKKLAAKNSTTTKAARRELFGRLFKRNSIKRGKG